MTSSQYIIERTNGALTLVNDYPVSTTVLDTNEFFAMMFYTEYQSYLRNYVQYKGFSNYNDDLDLYDIDINKRSYDEGYYISKDYQRISRLLKQIRENKGRILVVSVNDSSNVEFIDEGIQSISDPIATSATNITTTSLRANWNRVHTALSYRIDVSPDILFTTFLTGYENKDVSNVLTLNITGLDEGVTYYYRIRAYNNRQTSNNSNTITATTTHIFLDGLRDIDGTLYTSVIIGNKELMVGFLKVTHYLDGTLIPNLTDSADWLAEDGTPGHDGAYSYFDNDIANKTPYGGLYNDYVTTNTHGLFYFEKDEIPELGWRITNLSDWNDIIVELGGSAIPGQPGRYTMGGKLKEIGTTHWDPPNTGATNSSGMTAVPGGHRSYTNGIFAFIGSVAIIRGLDCLVTLFHNVEAIQINTIAGYEKGGYSICCIRDVSNIYVELGAGLTRYRKGVRVATGRYFIDYSDDGGNTWIYDIVSLEPTEDILVINIDNGVVGYRHRERDGSYVIEHELTPTGFLGIEGIDWKIVYELNP